MDGPRESGEEEGEPRLRPYERPEMPFERKSSLGGATSSNAALGFEFGALVAVFFLVGLYLDGKFGTHPWLKAAGALLGVGLGMFVVIRKVLREPDPEEDDG